MPAIATVGSPTMGACGANPSIIIQGIPTVTINGVPVATVGSPIVPHYRPHHTHGGVVCMGIPNITVNGIPVAVVGSIISCGDMVAQGVSTVCALG